MFNSAFIISRDTLDAFNQITGFYKSGRKGKIKIIITVRDYAFQEIGIFDWLSILLYLFGSWLNTRSEYTRFVWKKLAKNKGRLYTKGLFKYAMHINYTGDIILFIGFDSFALLPGFKKLDEMVINLGINEHYKSMSRGVIDIKDIVYFIVVVTLFTEATRLVLVSRNWKKMDIRQGFK